MSGGVFFLGDKLVSWLSKKKYLVPLSTAEEECIAATSCCTPVMWMKQTLKYIKVVYGESIHILYDNTSAINISKNLLIHSRSKYIAIWCHFLREKVKKKELKSEYVPTK